MTRKHLNLVFPQWQGSWPDSSTYHGALDMIRRYFDDTAYELIPVSPVDEGVAKHNIAAYQAVYDQLAFAKEVIDNAAPDTLFSIGGGCDADVTSIAYMNRKLGGNLVVLWLDAHADLNIPETSASKLLYGMPVRTLIGEGDPALIRLLGTKLLPEQVIQLGVRDIDPPEKEYLDHGRVRGFTVEEIENDLAPVVAAIRSRGRDNLYIHIDLDVLEPALFPYVPLPSAGGLSPETLTRLLRRLAAAFYIPGIGLYEYMPSPEPRVPLLEEIMAMGKTLR